jgi:hypothetical protein
MATDYASLLKNYGWDNLMQAIQSDPGWQQAYNSDRQAGYAVNIPGIGPVSLDSNGRINALDMNSAQAYQQTGNAPVYNTIWDGRNQETGAFNGSDPATYQVSHGGVSADTLGMLTAAAITAGIGTGYLPGLDAAGAGAGTGAMDMGVGGSGILPECYGGTAALSSGGGALGTAASGGSDLAAGAGGLDVNGLGLNQFSSGLPNVSSMTVGANGALQSGAGMDILDSFPSWLTDAAKSKAGSAIIGGLLGGMNGTSKVGDQTITTQQAIDPRMAQILYGSNGNNGFLSQLLAAGNTPQSAGLATFGSGVNNYLGNYGTDNLLSSTLAAQRLQDSNISAPTMTAATVGNVNPMQAAQVNAPNQNGLDLAPAYSSMIYGDPAQNPYLTGAIQKGIDQSSNAFGNMLTDATRNLTENILPNIRGGAIINGSMGGSRQGIAEGKALNDYSTQIGRAISQFGQNNTDAAVGAQAGAFSQGQDRALSAMSGLSGNQYGTAYQNAGFQQQANQTNYTGDLQKAMQDAQFQQQAAGNNQQAQLSTNALNSGNTQAGISASNGLLGSAYTYGTNQDSYGLNKTGKVSGLLGGYTGLGGSSTQTQPIYQNTTANVLGGGLLGANIYNLLNKS